MLTNISPIRNVMFTLHVEEWSQDHLQELFTKLSDSPLVKGFVYQTEVGEESGAKHYQGYVEFKTPLRLRRIKNIIGSATVHLEKRRGSRIQAIDYCSKVHTRVPNTDPVWYPSKEEFFGSGQGKRTDLLAVKDSIMSGASIKSICETHFREYCKYHSGITSAYSLLNKDPRRSWKTKVILILGPSGCGKSHRSWELAGQEAYVKPSGHQWFTGYRGQETVILDDFSSGFKMSMTVLLNLMDKYPYQVRVHGGLINFVAKTLIITSNTGPGHWYPDPVRDGRSLQTLYRRIDKVHIPAVPTIGGQSTLDDPRYAFNIIQDPANSEYEWKNWRED